MRATTYGWQVCGRINVGASVWVRVGLDWKHKSRATCPPRPSSPCFQGNGCRGDDWGQSRYAAGTAAMILGQAYLAPKFFWRSLFGSLAGATTYDGSGSGLENVNLEQYARRDQIARVVRATVAEAWPPHGY